MAIDIYILRNNKRHGPYPLENVRQGLSEGTFLPSDMAWHAGLDRWVTVNAVLTGTVEYRCSSCGSSIPPTLFRRISTGGWVFFFVLLLLCLPIALFGFLMKEEYSVCPTCGTRRTL